MLWAIRTHLYVLAIENVFNPVAFVDGNANIVA